MKDDIVIVSATRTPVGAFNGAFATVPAHELGKTAIKAALERAGVEGAAGLRSDHGADPHRRAGPEPGAPGLDRRRHPGRNAGLGRQSALRLGAAGGRARLPGHPQRRFSEIVVAGGQESMSVAPHCAYLRGGVKMGNFEMIDTMIKDGLWDAFNGYHMGNTAENVARQWQITRQQQDEFAVGSQNKAEAAQKAGKFKDEITPVTVKSRKGDIVVDADEYPKHGTTLEAVGKLRPAFDKEGTVTAGNASGINDGAAAVVLMKASEAAKLGKTPLARIVSWAQAGVDPKIMGTGPIPASRAALKKAGWNVGDLDLDRSQRGVRRAGLRGQQGPRLGHRQGQRQRRRHRDRPSDRRLGRPGAGDAALRDAEAQRQEGPCHALHRRRHGHCDVPGTLTGSSAFD